MYTPWWKSYAQVPNHDKEEAGTSSSNAAYLPQNNNHNPGGKESNAGRMLRSLEHIALIVLGLWFLSSFFYVRETCVPPSKLLASELPFAEEAVQYEDIVFDPSGFWENKSEKTPWEGPYSPETEAAWTKITSVGNLALPKKEYEMAGIESTEVETEPGKYLLTVEMFHQLHCLHYLKQIIDGHRPMEASHAADDAHLHHCVDYLRQVLMCHGDLTPISFYWDDDYKKAMPNFRIQHTCRSFDKIFDWAGKYHTDGAGDIE